MPRGRPRKTVPKPKEDECVVERVLGKKYIDTTDGQVAHYLIKWKGCDDPSNNTWEPVQNLEGCMELVEKYEAEKNGAPREDSNVSVDDKSDQGSTSTEYRSKGKAKLEPVEFGVLSSWPSHLVPLEMKGPIEVDGRLCYVIKHKTKKPYQDVSSENCVIVKAESFRSLFPQIVIQYYENAVFAERKKTPEQNANTPVKAVAKGKENGESSSHEKDNEKVVLDDVGLSKLLTEQAKLNELECPSGDEIADAEHTPEPS